MPEEFTVLIGAVTGAALTFVVQYLTARRQRGYELEDRTRAERLQATADLPPALVRYRHTQLSRRKHQLRTASLSDELDRGVRQARADAWSAVYRFELLVEHPELRRRAYALMEDLRALKAIKEHSELDRAGVKIHHGIQDLVRVARTELTSVEQ